MAQMMRIMKKMIYSKVDIIKKEGKMFEELPGFLSEFVKAEGGTSRGKVGVEVIKNNGGIISANVKNQNIINFPQSDSQKVLLAITQKLGDLTKSTREKETLNIRLEAKSGEITRMFITNEFVVEKNND